MHPGGAQAIFGIKANLGTYGKVIGGGISIGVIAGKKEYMDALDGGTWAFGDESGPEVGVTYFAGTFLRHPLALAAANASLLYMKEKGAELQETLNTKTNYLAGELNKICLTQGAPCSIVSFGSLWKVKFNDNVAYNELLFTLMRERGIHICDVFPCFLTEAHSYADIDEIILVFRQSLKALQGVGFFHTGSIVSKGVVDELAKTVTQNQVEQIPLEQPINEIYGRGYDQYTIDELPPIDGARIGKDAEGNPAWFITDPERHGKYLQVLLNN